MSLTYMDFINSKVESLSAGLIPQKEGSAMNIIQALENNYVQTLLGHFPFVFYLLNYKSKEFEFIHNCKILGYTDSEFLTGGLQSSLKNIHPADFQVISDELFPLIWEFVSTLPDNQSDYRFSLNFRYMRKDGTYMQLQQHMIFLDFEDNLPSRNLSVIYDISDIKNDTSINLVVTKVDTEQEDIVLHKKIHL